MKNYLLYSLFLLNNSICFYGSFELDAEQRQVVQSLESKTSDEIVAALASLKSFEKCKVGYQINIQGKYYMRTCSSEVDGYKWTHVDGSNYDESNVISGRNLRSFRSPHVSSQFEEGRYGELDSIAHFDKQKKSVISRDFFTKDGRFVRTERYDK